MLRMTDVGVFKVYEYKSKRVYEYKTTLITHPPLCHPQLDWGSIRKLKRKGILRDIEMLLVGLGMNNANIGIIFELDSSLRWNDGGRERSPDK